MNHSLIFESVLFVDGFCVLHRLNSFTVDVILAINYSQRADFLNHTRILSEGSLPLVDGETMFPLCQ